MRVIIATVCFTVLTMIGCVAADRSDSTPQDPQDTMTRVEEAVLSSPASDTATDINLLLAPTGEHGKTPQPQLKCIVDEGCVSCCHGGVCCSACGGGPVVCT